MLKPTIFREYDIRGIADVELLSPEIEILGQAFGTSLQRHGGPEHQLVPRYAAQFAAAAGCAPGRETQGAVVFGPLTLTFNKYSQRASEKCLVFTEKFEPPAGVEPATC